jgi:hypothetical protein
MTLLDFARGPGLHWSVLIMVAGVVWRLAGVALLPTRRNLAEPSHPGLGRRVLGAVAVGVGRTLPRPSFWPRVALGTSLTYTFHAGLFVILFFGAAHILLIKSVTGWSWTPLPTGLVALASGITLAAIIGCLVRRVAHPVLRLLSNFDDYFSLVLTFLPVLTGILLTEETFGAYGTLLALHILSVELLMVWLPFGKIIHIGTVIIGRATMGAKFATKGASP